MRERFRRGVGDLESLKKQFEELEAKSRSSYEGWAGLLEKVISRDGIDRFTSIIDKMTGTHLQIKGETIPMSYVVDYLGDINERFKYIVIVNGICCCRWSVYL